MRGALVGVDLTGKRFKTGLQGIEAAMETNLKLAHARFELLNPAFGLLLEFTEQELADLLHLFVAHHALVR